MRCSGTYVQVPLKHRNKSSRFVRNRSIHDVQCKLFDLDSKKMYKEHGVGQLYIKPLGNGRVQLIIRADNSLRNVIFNIAISETTSWKKAGKNGLTVVVVPNPSIKEDTAGQPIVALLRVKTDVHLSAQWDKIAEAKEKEVDDQQEQ
uniref:RanBD1 domain-containing protein n=1 Tax=Trichuris muris TaxID=70415 RepID=A0A5S6Q8L7_TRIMR